MISSLDSPVDFALIVLYDGRGREEGSNLDYNATDRLRQFADGL
jgi:hypothetical protein